jgi:hypothetical protein
MATMLRHAKAKNTVIKEAYPLHSLAKWEVP